MAMCSLLRFGWFSQEVQQQFVCFVLDCYMMFVGHCYVVGRVVGRCLTCFVFVM